MVTPSKYEQWIRVIDWHGIQQMWLSLQAGRVPGWEPGRLFEYLVLRAFELDGAEVRWPYTVTVHGQLVEQIDGAVYAGTLACIVEAKDSVRPVQFSAVTKLRQQLSRRPSGVLGLLFSRTDFTESARILAQFLVPQNILMWNGNELTQAIEQRRLVRALEAKYRYCVEHGQQERNLHRQVME